MWWNSLCKLSVSPLLLSQIQFKVTTIQGFTVRKEVLRYTIELCHKSFIGEDVWNICSRASVLNIRIILNVIIKGKLKGWKKWVKKQLIKETTITIEDKFHIAKQQYIFSTNGIDMSLYRTKIVFLVMQTV